MGSDFTGGLPRRPGVDKKGRNEEERKKVVNVSLVKYNGGRTGFENRTSTILFWEDRGNEECQSNYHGFGPNFTSDG